VISAAFRSWTQDPYPFFSEIKDIAQRNKDTTYILISHGHDDHFDDFILSSPPFRDFPVIIPGLASPGLRERVLRANPNRHICEVDATGINLNGLVIKNFINAEFTGDDTIFSIEDEHTFFVHANDNWHSYPRVLLDSIKGNISESKHVVYAVQLGIADCFPASYNYALEEMSEIISNRYEKYLVAVRSNAEALGASHIYSYANQSRIPAFGVIPHYQQFKKAFFGQNSDIITQLSPGSCYSSSSKFFSTVATDQKSPNVDVLYACLSIYEECARHFINLKGNLLDQYEFRFLVNNNSRNILNPTSDNLVTIEADPEVWSSILTGNDNIECITVGGCGTFTKPISYNISCLHHLLCKWTYRQQSVIKAKGFGFYLGF